MSMPSSSEEVATSARTPAGLEVVLDLEPLRARDGAVVRLDQQLAGQLVQRAGQPLRHAPAVHEEERGAVRPDELEEPRVDGGPDRRARPRLRLAGARDVQRLAEARHVLDRHLDPQLERLARAGVHHRHRPVRHPDRTVAELVQHRRGRRREGRAPAATPPARPRGGRGRQGRRRLGPAQEARHLVERPLRGGEADPLQPPPGTAAPAARARAPGGRRAWWARARGSRPRSPSRPGGGPRGRRR